MLFVKAFNICKTIINKNVSEYKEDPDNQIQDSKGNITYKPSPLLLISDDDIVFQLGISLINVALQTTPITLLEDTQSSSDSVLKIISTTKFIRVPATPVAVTSDNKDTQILDIDDALAYAVIFDCLANLWGGFSNYGQKANLIIMNFNNAYKPILQNILDGTTSKENSYTAIRFSSDNENWHSDFQTGDVFISFKKPDTNTWSAGIKFVGTSCSDTQFIALKDTPSTYKSNKGKVLVVNDSENGLIFTSMTGGGSGSGGASDFIGLTDTPSSYGSANAGAVVTVNSSANGLVFTKFKSTLLEDMPQSLASQGGKVLAVKSDASGYELISQAAQASSSGIKAFFSSATGTISLDGFAYTDFLIFPSDDGDVTLTWKKNSASAYAVAGQSYNINVAMYKSNSAKVDDDGGNIVYVGDTSIATGSGSSNTNTTLTSIKMVAMGNGEFAVLSNITTLDV